MTDNTNTAWLDSSAIAIVGGKGSGKTALAYSLLDQMNRPIYAFANPKPELITDRGWKVMHRLEQMYEVNRCVVWCDEIQLTVPTADKRANEGLQKLLSIARHRDITLLISTCDTRWVTRSLEAFIDAWCVTDVEAALVKRGSLIGKIIKKFVVIDPDQFHLERGQYLFYARAHPDLDGLRTFDVPAYWTDAHSKPYALDVALEVRVNCEPTAPVVRNGQVRV